MEVLRELSISTAWLADIVYPLLAFAAALTSCLAFSWHLKPPRPRHPLNLVIGVISALMVIPALLASAATGVSPTFDIVSVRFGLRVAWLLVACGFLLAASYYVRRFITRAEWHIHKGQFGLRLLTDAKPTDNSHADQLYLNHTGLRHAGHRADDSRQQ